MQKKNPEYIARLREVMAQHGIDAIVVSGTDPHQSELPPHHWRGREWLTGLWSENGTNGTAVVTADKALCWTDSRFFIQADRQLPGTGFSMMPLDGPNAVDLVNWLVENLDKGQTVGIDGMTFSISYAQRLEQELSDNGIKLNDEFPLFDYIYPDRPERPKNKLFIHDEKIVGETVASKMQRIMAETKAELANAVLLSTLDDIAWATNLRTAGDIAFSPIFVAYLYISDNEKVLFIDHEKITPEVSRFLEKYGIREMSYDNIRDFVAVLPKETRLLIDPANTSRGLYDHIGCTPVFGGAGIARLKSIKTETMLGNLDIAMEKDGVALVRFFMMVEKEFPSHKLTELDLSKRLRAIRLADKSCVDESFAPILGWNGNGALAHYEATEETNATLDSDGILLVDSGGQYIYGTTDITRTVVLGTPTAEQKRDFTLAAKGTIALANIKFPVGTRGSQLDVLARQFLWNDAKAYYHGTGHGVGFFINCHEGPQSIRTQENPVTLEPGMILSDEPAFYNEGNYGFRTENLMVVEPWVKNQYGDFLQFKTVTLFPIDLNLFDTSIMSDAEIEWVNNYHNMVRERLTPLLTSEEAEWLASKTVPLKK